MVTKCTLFVGLNDKGTKLQEISTVDASKIVYNLIRDCFGFGTVSEAVGIYTHQDGTNQIVVENTLRVELLFFDVDKIGARASVIPFIQDVKRVLNQETVAAQFEEIESELI